MTAQQQANLVAVVKVTLAQLRGSDFQSRRRGVMYISSVLGHKIGPEQLRDQAWGAVGQCATCGMIAKAARDGDMIEGQATASLCQTVKVDEK